MARPSGEAAKGLSKSAVARIAGITPGHYGNLLAEEVAGAKPSRLLPAIGGDCTLIDCIRVVVLKSLIDALNRSARAAYCRIRDRIPELILLDELDAVYDPQTGSCRLCTSLNDLAETVRTRRPVIVVPLGTIIAEARKRFMEQAKPPRPAARSRRRSTSSLPRGHPS